MNTRFFIYLLLFGFPLLLNAQSVKKIYNEDINPLNQIDEAIVKAKREEKFVICQVGGNWCPWCLKFADFITTDSLVSKTIEDNFVFIHVNYNPRTKQQPEKEELTKLMMKRLNNPARFGFPVLVVLDQTGKVIHIQDSGFLEEGNSYNRDKVMTFLKNWTPEAVKE